MQTQHHEHAPMSGRTPELSETSAEAVVTLLEHVESVGAARSGVFTIAGTDGRGMVLVEEGRVCWASSREMRRRLTDLLCAEGSDRATIEEVVQACRRDRTPIGEALLRAGVVTEGGLRAALLRHTSEAIAKLSGGESESFVPHRHARYDARFSFTPLELLTSIGASWHPEDEDRGRAELAQTLGEQGVGVAFVPRGKPMMPVASVAWTRTMRELLDFGRWATQLDAVARSVDERTRISCGLFDGRVQAFAWRRGGLLFAGFADDPRTLARALFRHRAR